MRSHLDLYRALPAVGLVEFQEIIRNSVSKLGQISRNCQVEKRLTERQSDKMRTGGVEQSTAGSRIHIEEDTGNDYGLLL